MEPLERRQKKKRPIANDSFLVVVNDGIGALGRIHTERGLTHYDVALCHGGHMCVYMIHLFFFI